MLDTYSIMAFKRCGMVKRQKRVQRFRSVALTSDDLNSTVATFQVYALEGIGNGVEDGKFAGTNGNAKLIFDADFEGLDAAAAKFNELVADAQRGGFRPFSFMDMIEYEEKLQQSRK